jgi:hypothetical protein
VGDIDLKVISTTENSNKFQKTIIGFPFIFGYSKNQYIHCETMLICSVSLFFSRFTLGSMAQATLVTMKEGSLFCLYLWDPSNLDASDRVLGLFWKLLRKRVHGLGFTSGVEVLEYWKIKLNRIWKFQRNWNVPLVLLERSWWVGFNGTYLVRFGFRMWEILVFKWFLLLKIQINSKKPGFGRKNQLRTW